MVVIVIRVPGSTDGSPPSISYRDNGKALNGQCGDSTGPPSYDSGVNTDPGDLKLFLKENRTVYDRDLTRLESSSKDSGFGGYVEYQRIRDLELLREIHEGKIQDVRQDSPVSKDSGFSDRARPCRITKIKYYPRPESREKSTSTTYLSSRSSQPDTDNNTVTFLSCSSQADPDNSVATTKEEEWVTKKKVELTTKRQIETRVKRQLVVEDGKVVEDSGPIVTTNTTEDTEKQEHNQTERRTTGDDPPGEDWIATRGPGGLVKEVKEKTIRSREETQERLETEDVQHIGDISDEGYRQAVSSGNGEIRHALESSRTDKALVERTPRIVHQSSKTKKVIDTEDTEQLSELQANGKMITETKRTTQHEEIEDSNRPDADRTDSPYAEETAKDSSHRYRKTKEQDLTEYLMNGVKVGQKMRYQTEATEGERHGDPMDIDPLDSLSTRLRRMRLRSQNHKLAVEGAPLDRKDALTRKPLNFDQEEEARKVETSKWLEHHFGSESTKSSKGSMDDLAEQPPTSHNGFINVTMTSLGRSPLPPSPEELQPYKLKMEQPREIFLSSPEQDSPPNNGYFQGISHWAERRTSEDKRHISTSTPLARSVKIESPTSPPESPPYLITSHHINPVRYDATSPDGRYNGTSSMSRHITTNNTGYIRERSPSPVRIYRTSSSHVYQDDVDRRQPSPPRRKLKESNGYGRVEYDLRSWDARPKREEPRPDYTPPSRSPSPSPDELPPNKKVYQRTRFAADIPPPQTRQYQVKHKSKLGESFRKFVGKLRSSSSERKTKKRQKSDGSRSPSPKENTYQPYNMVDNNIPSAATRVGREVLAEPVAPPRARPYKSVHSATQAKPTADMDRKSGHVQRYYLGEDPFSGSIYGREREYDGVIPVKSSRRIRNGTSRRSTDEHQSSTLGRLSKSTSRLVGNDLRTYSYDYDRGGVQTLPRKLRTETNKRPVEAQRSLEGSSLSPPSWQYTSRHSSEQTRQRSAPHYGGSLINVSFVNQISPPSSSLGISRPNGVQLNGPAKPARTYRSNLARSKSFNVQAGDYTYKDSYKSNPQLHRLDEAPPPLKSPGIISSLNRSSRDVTEEGFNFATPRTDEKRKLFMRGLLDRAPELFRTIHGDELDKGERKRVDYSNSLRSNSTESGRQLLRTVNGNGLQSSYQEVSPDGNTTKSVVRRGSSSNDDYSETVRIISKSDDPRRPSETNTVQTFSKKTTPSRNGLSTETIESSETKTVMKSRYLGDNNSATGIVIDTRK